MVRGLVFPPCPPLAWYFFFFFLFTHAFARVTPRFIYLGQFSGSRIPLRVRLARVASCLWGAAEFPTRLSQFCRFTTSGPRSRPAQLHLSFRPPAHAQFYLGVHPLHSHHLPSRRLPTVSVPVQLCGFSVASETRLRAPRTFFRGAHWQSKPG